MWRFEARATPGGRQVYLAWIEELSRTRSEPAGLRVRRLAGRGRRQQARPETTEWHEPSPVLIRGMVTGRSGCAPIAGATSRTTAAIRTAARTRLSAVLQGAVRRCPGAGGQLHRGGHQVDLSGSRQPLRPCGCQVDEPFIHHLGESRDRRAGGIRLLTHFPGRRGRVAWSLLVRRHDMDRSGFAARGDRRGLPAPRARTRGTTTPARRSRGQVFRGLRQLIPCDFDVLVHQQQLRRALVPDAPACSTRTTCRLV